MMQTITDIELASKLDGSLLEHYQTALVFINALPDYSLLQFRELTTAICMVISNKTGFELQNSTLEEYINALHNAQCISKPMASTLHETRQLGNAGAHVRKFQSDDVGDLNTFREKLTQKAKCARKLSLEAMDTLYCEYFPNKKLPQIQLVLEGGQEDKETLFKALCSSDWKVKYQAGLLLMQVAREQDSARTSIMVSSSYEAHHEFLLKQALVHFEAAFKASADVGHDWEKIQRISAAKEESHALARYAKLEPLFSYAELAREGVLGDDRKQEALSLLIIAADRGYAPAMALYGAEVYFGIDDREPDYKLALRYLQKAASAEESSVYRFLYYFYSEGKALPVDAKQALSYLNDGIELECADCLAELGIAYHKGILVDPDDALAEKHLKNSITAGSVLGKNYYTIEFNDLAGHMSKHFQALGAEWLNQLDTLKQKPKLVGNKPKVNAPCTCGSGKKSKKCCYNPATNSNYPINPNTI